MIIVFQGIYPTIVIVVVALERSLNKTTFWQQSTTAWAGEHHDHSAQLDDRTQVSSVQSPRSHIQFAQDFDEQHDEARSLAAECGKSVERGVAL